MDVYNFVCVCGCAWLTVVLYCLFFFFFFFPHLDTPLAVRSSAPFEDGGEEEEEEAEEGSSTTTGGGGGGRKEEEREGGSFAGMYETKLGVRGLGTREREREREREKERNNSRSIPFLLFYILFFSSESLFSSLRCVWSSLWSPHAIYYRRFLFLSSPFIIIFFFPLFIDLYLSFVLFFLFLRQHGLSSHQMSMAVVVMRCVDAEVCIDYHAYILTKREKERDVRFLLLISFSLSLFRVCGYVWRAGSWSMFYPHTTYTTGCVHDYGFVWVLSQILSLSLLFF